MHFRPSSRLAAVALWAAAAASSAETCIPLEVRNVRPGRGSLMVAAFDSEAAFGKTAAGGMRLPAGETTMTLRLCLPDARAVALVLYQDLNDSGTLDKNLVGIPSEPWGATAASGVAPRFGAPTWESAQVPLDGRPVVVKLSP